jgi:uncharacterized membrane protein
MNGLSHLGQRSDKRSGTRSGLVLFKLLLVAALIVRLLSLTGEGFWLDEAYSFYQARNPFLFSADNPFHLVKLTSRLSFIRHILADDIHPPFYYGQLALWSQAGLSDLWMRLNSVLWGMVTLPVTYFFAQNIATTLGDTAVQRAKQPATIALVSTALVAFSPFFVEMSVELRMYGLMAFLAVVSVSSLYRIVQSHGVAPAPTRWPWIAYTLANTLFIYSQGIGFLWLPVQGLLYAGLAVIERWQRRQWPTYTRAWLLSQGVTVLAFLPWALLVLTMSGRIRGANYLRVPTLLDLLAVPGQLLFGNAASFSYPSPPLEGPVGLWIGLGSLTLGFVAIALWILRRHPVESWLLAVPSLGALGLVYLLSVTVRPVFILRAFSFTVPFFAVLVALGIVVTAREAAAWSGRVLGDRPRMGVWLGLLLACLLGLNVWGVSQGIATVNRTQWQPVGQLLNQQVQANDVVVVPYSSAGEFLLYNSVPRSQYTGELIEQLRLYWREAANFTKVWGPDYEGFLHQFNLDYQKNARLLLLTDNLAQMERHRPPNSRVWVVTSPGRTEGELDRYQARLRETKTLRETHTFFRTTVMLYD